MDDWNLPEDHFDPNGFHAGPGGPRRDKPKRSHRSGSAVRKSPAPESSAKPSPFYFSCPPFISSNGRPNLSKLSTWFNLFLGFCVPISPDFLQLYKYASLCQGLQPQFCKRCCSQQASQSLPCFEGCTPAIPGYTRDKGIGGFIQNTTTLATRKQRLQVSDPL